MFKFLDSRILTARQLHPSAASTPWPSILPFSSLPLAFSSQYSSGSESQSLLRLVSPPVQSQFRCWEISEISNHRSSGYQQEIGQSSMVIPSTSSLGDLPHAPTGDVVYLHVLGISLVFINSVEATSDLLDKRGSIYSDKPSLVMAGELWVSRVSQNEPTNKYVAISPDVAAKTWWVVLSSRIYAS